MLRNSKLAIECLFKLLFLLGLLIMVGCGGSGGGGGGGGGTSKTLQIGILAHPDTIYVSSTVEIFLPLVKNSGDTIRYSLQSDSDAGSFSSYSGQITLDGKGSGSLRLSYTAPDTPGSYTYTLVVNEGSADSVSTDFMIFVAAPGRGYGAGPYTGSDRNTECNDGIDNDGDGFIDGDDLKCGSASDNTEEFGTVYYTCNCLEGADGNCVSGSDGNAGTDPNNPWQTFEKVRNEYNSINAGDTIAFCRGGAFHSLDRVRMDNDNCRENNRCVISDYTAPWASGDEARPIISAEEGAFHFSTGNVDHREGVVIRDLILKGVGDGSPGSINHENAIFFFNDMDHVLLDNLDISGFAIGVFVAEASPAAEGVDVENEDIILRNSKITDNYGQGWLGAGRNLIIENNYFDNNGFGLAIKNHNIYISGHKKYGGAPNVRISGNELHHSTMIEDSEGNRKCEGASLVAHGTMFNLTIEDNLIQEDVGGTKGTCWGIAIDSGYKKGENFDQLVIRRNRVVNVGNLAIGCSACYNSIIENNVVVTEEMSIAQMAIGVPNRPDGYNDALTSNNIIRNNTVYYNGIQNPYPSEANLRVATIHVEEEGAGTSYVLNNVIMNNGISDVLTSHGFSFDCIDEIGSGTISRAGNACVSSNPGFINVGFTNSDDYDFNISALATSLIDAGVNTSQAADDDFNRYARDAFNDIGAFEYFAPAATKTIVPLTYLTGSNVPQYETPPTPPATPEPKLVRTLPGSGYGSQPYTGLDLETECNDGDDNDGDGFSDQDDPNCATSTDDDESGTVYYACNCLEGADSTCVAGDDDINDGTDPEYPWQTFEKMRSQFSSLDAGDALAFCQGGSFETEEESTMWVNGNCTKDNRCVVGDYKPLGITKELENPKIFASLGVFYFEDAASPHHEEGYVIRNLILNGSLTSYGFHFFNDIDHVLLDNLVINQFSSGVQIDGSNPAWSGNSDVKNEGIILRNSTIINNVGQGLQGGGDDLIVENNYFFNNGYSRYIITHNIYISSGDRVRVSGNELFASTMYLDPAHPELGRHCSGASFVVHGVMDDLIIEDNLVREELGEIEGSCWGIVVDGGYSAAESFENVIIRRNKVVNVGGIGIGCTSCSDSLIENNIIIHEQPFYDLIGIAVPNRPRGDGDALTSNNIIRNNTIYYDSQDAQSGIKIEEEGSGTSIAVNNLIINSGAGTFQCIYNVGPSADVSNNSCINDTSDLVSSNPSGDPVLYDFTPTSSAGDLINKGDNLSWASDDFTKASRDATPDIGALEF